MMRPAQFTPHELIAVFRRRWKYPAYSTAIVTVICIIGAFVLTRKYESTTTILVRPDKTLNPIPSYEMVMAFEEQLRNFSEIIYSRSVLEQLADSLAAAAAPFPADLKSRLDELTVEWRSVDAER